VAAYNPAESRNIFANSRGRHSRAERFSLSSKFVARAAPIGYDLATIGRLVRVFNKLYIVEIATIM
jgi:hypothetical protein